ncbi:hypothetical protein EBQ74_05620 [bacterium]|nr:hypothetical protein [bacterium]
MERLVVLNTTGEIRPEDLPQEIGGSKKDNLIRVPIGLPLKRVEKLLFEETLRSTKGDKKLAAKLLGVHPRTIYRFLEQCSSSLPETTANPTEAEMIVGEVPEITKNTF